MDAAGGTSDSVVLILAFLSFLGVTVPPIIVALISRTRPRETPAGPPPDPQLWVPRTEWTELYDRLSRADDENDRLSRAVERLGRDLDEAREQRLLLRLELARYTSPPPLDPGKQPPYE